ncbi:DUF4179 domain-containing protein [Subdoligranulum variabile]|uniref:DUF4179 domain-containing protein n=1 Tax=Subdoligranulum variabile DSM 15176 TaxID=411471 RepID=D1PLT7_9FIRM|nr:DUF4179 domain-containing protein [Subdoligranulum variabile]EFB76385.1 hypothetical protein SUBVAR_05304 [Subdoligranulum variabile DSM 15176]UWP67874.1 DUF4179 domain-containing protein [Subdoligranulum variabile]
MYDDRDLMNCLNNLASDDEPLTKSEMDALSMAVLHRIREKSAHSGRRYCRRKWPVWGKVLVSGVACAVLLVGLNGFNPALAQDLPVLGDVFAYINHLTKAPLQSEQLTEYAQSVQLQAESSEQDAPESDAQQDTLGLPYAVTLSQVYCDELYLRVGLVLTAEDDSLAGFETVTIDPPLLWEDTTEAEANTLYGGVTLNGEPVTNDLLPCFRKQDARTFVCEMDYNLQNYTGDTQDMQASLTLSHLVGVKTGDGVVGSEVKTPLQGSYTLSFTVSADASLTRTGQIEGGEQNGVRLFSVKATPGETRTEYAVTGALPGDATPALRLFAVQGGTWTKLQPASGNVHEDDVQSCTVHTDYFDAVPEGVTELCAQVLDKNAEEEAILAQWTITLPQ